MWVVVLALVALVAVVAAAAHRELEVHRKRIGDQEATIERYRQVEIDRATLLQSTIGMIREAADERRDLVNEIARMAQRLVPIYEADEEQEAPASIREADRKAAEARQLAQHAGDGSQYPTRKVAPQPVGP